jgi:hypothetical protein
MRGWVLGALLALSGCGVRSVVVVDRIEEGVAVLVDERGQQQSMPAAQLPPGAAEGAVLVDGEPDGDERRRLIEEAQARRARLLADDGRDLDLTSRR